MALFDVVVAEVEEHGNPVQVLWRSRLPVIAPSSRAAGRKALVSASNAVRGIAPDSVRVFTAPFKAEPM